MRARGEGGCCGEAHGDGCGCGAAEAPETVDARGRLERYAAAATAASTGSAACCNGEAPRAAQALARASTRLRTATPCPTPAARLARLWQPHRRRRSPKRRSWTRIGRRIAVSASGGSDRESIRPRHDRRDARSRLPKPARGHVENVESRARSRTCHSLTTRSTIISNCVINLRDKPRVFREAAGCPRGRIAVSDVVADPDMDEPRAATCRWTGASLVR